VITHLLSITTVIISLFTANVMVA